MSGLRECKMLMKSLQSLEQRVKRHEYPEYTQWITREEVTDIGVLETSRKDVLRDITRDTLVAGKAVISNEKFDHVRVEVFKHVASHNLYYQGMDTVCMPIIYAGLQTGKSEQEIKESCFVFLEVFYHPLVKNNFQKYIAFESVIRNLPEYKSRYKSVGVEEEHLKNIPVNMDPILLWFSRDFVFEELVPVYCFFMNSSLHMPFLFYLAAIDELIAKVKTQKSARCISETYTDSNRISAYIQRTKDLNTLYSHNFMQSLSHQKIKSMVLYGALGVGVALAGVAYVFLSKKDNNR
ncbi:hypothetical protein NECID01_0210 [Nematocida sp. AWRm77]|nr:hypothetical protein NECID01_0210 [Nematocida sp. AWRm77]